LGAASRASAACALVSTARPHEMTTSAGAISRLGAVQNGETVAPAAATRRCRCPRSGRKR